MDKYFDKTFEFNDSMGQPVGKNIMVDSKDMDKLILLRMDLIREEVDELEDALIELEMGVYHHSHDQHELLAHLFKELADLQYVLSGFASTFGIPLEDVFDRVHASNMSKLGEDGKPLYREDGKILKGPNYKEPDLSDIVEKYMAQ